jgi:hypothetical protein
MRKKLKDVLTRLAEQRDASVLGDDDWNAIEEALGRKGDADADAPRPLWGFLREQTSRWKTLLELPLDWMGNEIDAILLEAGADPSLRLDNARSRKSAVITRAGLSASVKKHMAHDQASLRGWAYLLVGLARLDEHVGAMVEALAAGREEREAWTTTTTVPPMLESLAMLRHPRAAELAKKFVNHNDDRLRRAAQACTLLSADALAEGALADMLDAGISAPIILGFPDGFVKAKQGGLDLEQRLRGLSQSHYKGGDFWTIAEMAAQAGLDDLYKTLLEPGSNWEARFTVLHHAVATGRIAHFKDMLAKEHDDNAIVPLVAGLGVHLPEAERRPFLEDKLKNGGTAHKVGAILAAVKVPGLDDALAAAAADSDQDIHAALQFAAAGRCNPVATELLDVALLRLARSYRNNLARLGGAVLRGAGLPVPDVAIDAGNFDGRQPAWRDEPWEETFAFYRRRPDLLVRRLHHEVTRDSEMRMRAIRIAAMLGGPLMEHALEQRLDGAEYNDELGELYLECLCHGGPRSPLGQTIGLLNLHEASYPVTLPPTALTAAVVLAIKGNDSNVKSRAAAVLHQLGEAAEPYLRLVAHASTDTYVGRALGQSLALIHGAADPVVGDLARLMNGEAKQVEDLELGELALAAGAPAIRAKLAELGASTPEGEAQATRYLIALAGDPQDDVALGALDALARRHADARWVQELIILQSRSSNWTVSRQAVSIMGSSGSTGFVPRLLEILAEAQNKNDSELGNRCVTAMQNIADANPALGMLVLDIREPHLVNTRYGLNAQVDWNTDRRSESQRLLMSALDQRKNAASAASAKGKTALFSKPGAAATSVAKTVPASELESLLLYFKVTFADEETGSIVAEIGEEPTGELLTALLQTESVAVLTAGWT